MTVTALHRPSPSGVAGLVAAARAAVTDGMGVPAGALSEDEIGEAVAGLAALESQVAAWRLSLAREADRRGLAAAAADTGTDAWLARLTGERRELLRGGLVLARWLEETYAVTRAALAAGRIRIEQARVIVEGLQPSAGDATGEQQAQAEELLVAKATGEASPAGTPMTPRGLRRAARRVYATIDADLSARHLSRSVHADERRGASDTWLTLGDRGDGTFVGRFAVPERHGQMLQAVLDRLTAPRRFSRDEAGGPVVDETAGGRNGGLGWADKMGLALCELIEHLPLDKLSRSAVTLLVHLDLDTLRRDVASALDAAGVGAGGVDAVARLSTGADLSAAEARRLACEAGIVPVVLGGASQPLDLGRTRRLHTDAQRQALAVLHDTCAIAGCDRPFAWCEVHHPHAWATGGRTDLVNALPLCGHHHRAAHDPWLELLRHSRTEWTFRRRRRR